MVGWPNLIGAGRPQKVRHSQAADGAARGQGLREGDQDEEGGSLLVRLPHDGLHDATPVRDSPGLQEGHPRLGLHAK